MAWKSNKSKNKSKGEADMLDEKLVHKELTNQ